MKLSTLMWGVCGGVIAGVASTGVVWKPSEHVVYTGFPFPIGVGVERGDGTSDGGYSPLGWVVNPLLYVLAFFAIVAVVSLTRRLRRSRQTVDVERR